MLSSSSRHCSAGCRLLPPWYGSKAMPSSARFKEHADIHPRSSHAAPQTCSAHHLLVDMAHPSGRGTMVRQLV